MESPEGIFKGRRAMEEGLAVQSERLGSPCRYVVYGLHVVVILGVLVGWVVWRPLGLTMPLTGLAWALMEDRCCLTELEERWFVEALIPGRVQWWGRAILWCDVLFWSFNFGPV